MDKPTADAIRSWSKIDFDEYGFGLYDTESGGDPLIRVVDASCSYITFVTARQMDVDTPALLVPLLEDAVRMRSEQIVMQQQGDTVETAGDVDLISSISVGGYSETRRDTTTKPEKETLNPWPALDKLLWLLLSPLPGENNPAVEERLDYWLALQSGIQAPAWQTIEVDWSHNYYGQYGVAEGAGGYPHPLTQPFAWRW